MSDPMNTPGELPVTFRRDCATRTVLDHVTSRWGVLILLGLYRSTLRWGELRTAVDGISEKMLNQNLRTFQDDGFVTRTSHPEVPPRVEYSLTPLGRDLVEHLLPLTGWIAANADSIVGSPSPTVNNARG
ncbi:winged helix-turn-helix transcriptional regulator [Streptomyces paludis]|uniref:Transcriptional regulator n=1 Tax=Streptomyces paludis TaxID=2282738 RepID=A0A345HVY2_9ACTN|nr:helix-turn-helix domain-containing protein [Streptomyces paludis]AXG79171.1 transcriptional regulator [Streptomyces paludis]AXG80856.1 transcriptional regulator [Streptomyces paludis]